MTNTTLPLGYEITHRFEALDLSEAEFDAIIARACWAETPTFYKRGRMAMYTPSTPRSHRCVTAGSVCARSR